MPACVPLASPSGGAGDPGGACVHAVTGRLVDDHGAAIADAVVTVCANACFVGRTDESGRFSVPIGQYIRVDQYALLAHVNPRHAAFYLSLPAPAGTSIAF